MDTSRNPRYYGEIATQYDQIVANADYALPDALFEWVSNVEEIEGARVLDIGIGTGLSSIRFAQAGARVTGIDASTEMLSICRNKSFTNNLILFDVTEGGLPSTSCKFDIVICLGLFEFVLHPYLFL